MLAFGSYGGDLDFWNPTTNQCYSTSVLDLDQSRYPQFMKFQLQRTTVFYQDTTCSSSSHDHQYKLLQMQRVVQPNGGGSICQLRSYNLEANGFTTFLTLSDESAAGQNHDMRLALHSQCCFVNGALHLFVSSDGASHEWFRSDLGIEVFALHLGTLECYKLPFPFGAKYGRGATLMVLGGYLCATFTDFENDTKGYAVDVWVMKEYGGEWTKLLNFTTKLIRGIYHTCVYPIAYSQSRDKLLLHFRHPYDSLWWYHLKQEKLIPVRIPGAPKFFQPRLCLPSFVNYQC
ncbi:hypothetical protein Tsubulata_046774 [Turnera subulata]|uniref:F-box associated domain-containing protein n=1 Tax=Turnera subulata TaxID=218843 RepID=A0A9Q0JCT3_9ROSI|nr:hypothetical protein Tsubulata_046774 [Turnera subulata]